MNHVYKIVWNHAKALFEVTSELGTSGKSSASTTKKSKNPLKTSTFAMRSKCAFLIGASSLFAMPAMGAATYIDDAVIATPGTLLNGYENRYVISGTGKLIVSTLDVFTIAKDGFINLDVAGAQLENKGRFENSGTISAFAYNTKLVNSGAFHNNGVIGGWGVNIENNGVMFNLLSGVIDAPEFNNWGGLTNNGNAKVTFNTFNNKAGGTPELGVFNSGVFNLKNTLGIINNDGYFQNTLDGKIDLELGKKLTFNNSVTGKFHNDGFGIVADPARFNQFIGQINNYGEVKNTSAIPMPIYNYGNGVVENTNDGVISGTITLYGDSTFKNYGKFKTGLRSSGIYAGENSHIDNWGSIKLNHDGDPISQKKELTLKGNASLNNIKEDGVGTGEIILDDADVQGSGTFPATQITLNIGKNAQLNNDGLVQIKDTLLQSDLKLNGTFNNGSTGTLDLGKRVFAYIGHERNEDTNDDDTSLVNHTATLTNAGVIQGSGATGDDKSVVRMSGGQVKLVSEAGSTFKDAELQITYRRFLYGNYNGELTNATLQFNGQSNFNPSAIVFNNDEVSMASGNPTLTQTLNIDVADGVVNKLGKGSLILDGQSNYGQGTNVEAGALYIGGTVGSTAKIEGPVTVKNAATLGGHGTINGHVNVAAGGRLSAGLGAADAGKLTIGGNLTLNANSQIDLSVSDAGSDSYVVKGNLATNGAKLNLASIGTITTGLVHQIFEYGTATNTNLVIGTTPGGIAANKFSITHAGNKIYINSNVTLGGDTTLKFWNPGSTTQAMGGGGNGTWGASSTTWTNADGTLAPGVLDAGADLAVFGGAKGTVNVNGTVAAKGLQFLNNYTLTGGTIALDSGTTGQTYISTSGTTTSNNQVTINSDITAANGINKMNGGTLILTGNNNIPGGIIVTEGTLQGNSNSLAGNITNNAQLVFNQTTDGTYTGVLSGTGNITKQGTGTLNLTGSSGSTFTGNFKVSQGALQGPAGSFTGNIENNTKVIFNDVSSTQTTYAGNMSGTGSVEKIGLGTSEITGTNSYKGGTTIKEGGLLGNTNSLQGNIQVNENTLLWTKVLWVQPL